jgi:DNA replication licensing factor MCM5
LFSDANLAKHVINVHRYRDQAVAEIQKDIGPIDIKLLKKYIAYSRQRCQPRLSNDAAEMLKNQYVKFRSNIAQNKPTAGPTNIPMTVRQLEAIVRISEALARMELSSVAHTSHVLEAIRLFQVSTYRAATTGVTEGGVGSVDFDRHVKNAENELSNRFAIGTQNPTQHVIKYLIDRSFERHVALRALDHLVQRGQFRYKKQQKMVERCG